MILKIVNVAAPAPERTWWLSDVKNLQLLGIHAFTPERADIDNVLYGTLQLFNESIGSFVLSEIDIMMVPVRHCDWSRAGYVYWVEYADGTTEHVFVSASEAYLTTDAGDTIQRLNSQVPPSIMHKIQEQLGNPDRDEQPVGVTE